MRKVKELIRCLFTQCSVVTVSIHIGFHKFSAENKIKAGQLNAMDSLLEMMRLHKADPRVAANAAGALQAICVNGVLSMNSRYSSVAYF